MDPLSPAGSPVADPPGVAPSAAVADLLRMEGISKSFGANRVLNGVDFRLAAGEVHALLGENGAGKSTLMKILMGIYPADAGRILFAGEDITSGSVRDHLHSGIAMIFQELSLLPNTTVALNLFAGREPRLPGWRVDYRRVQREAQAAIDRFGFALRAGDRVRDLPFAKRQLVEILKTLSRGARILIMDEPTSSLSAHEEEKLFAIINDLKALGIGVIYISHRLAEIFRIANRISIVKDGNIIGPFSPREISGRQVASLMSRTAPSELSVGDLVAPPEKRHGRDELALGVRAFSTDRKLRDVTFAVGRGEIVGLAGLVGSGRSTLAKGLFGLLRDARGELTIAGRRAMVRSPQDALRHGVGFVPEDRRLEGLIVDHSVQTNLALPNLRRLLVGGWAGVISGRRAQELYERFRTRLQIVSQHPSQPAKELSGGNQQKIVFAKWLATDPTLLILDEPTAGVDVHAKAEMRQLIQEVARQGVGVLLISSELDEVIATADRILLMVDGTVREEGSRFANEAELRSALQERLGAEASPCRP